MDPDEEDKTIPGAEALEIVMGIAMETGEVDTETTIREEAMAVTGEVTMEITMEERATVEEAPDVVEADRVKIKDTTRQRKPIKMGMALGHATTVNLQIILQEIAPRHKTQ